MEYFSLNHYIIDEKASYCTKEASVSAQRFEYTAYLASNSLYS